MVRKWHAAAALGVAFAAAAAAAAVAADRGLSLVGDAVAPEEEMGLLKKVANLLWKGGASTYQHVWPVTITDCFIFSSICSISFDGKRTCFFFQSLHFALDKVC